MRRKLARLYLTITVVFFIAAVFLFIACGNFMKPLDDFIRDSSSMVYGTPIYMTPHFVRADKSVAIPPNETTIININIHNPRNFEMIYTFTGAGEERGVFFESTDHSAKITIVNPGRLETFDLTLYMETEDRPMITCKLPFMEARYLNADLSILAVNDVIHPDRSIIDESNPGPPFVFYPVFDRTNTNYTVDVPYRTTGLNVTANLRADIPDGEYASFKVDDFGPFVLTPGGTTLDVPLTAGLDSSTYLVTAAVTADSSEVRPYILRVPITPPPAPEDFYIRMYYNSGSGNIYTGYLESRQTWRITYNSRPMNAFIEHKYGIPQSKIKWYYNGSTTPPADLGSYVVTIDTEPHRNYVSVTGLTVGILEIIPQEVSFTGGFTDEFFDLTKESNNNFKYNQSLSIIIQDVFDNYQFYLNGEPRYYYTQQVVISGISYRRYIINMDYINTPVGEHTLTAVVTKYNGSNTVYYSKEVKFRVEY